jgi:hypothetical protein
VFGARASILHRRKRCLCCCPHQVRCSRLFPSHRVLTTRLQQRYKRECLRLVVADGHERIGRRPSPETIHHSRVHYVIYPPRGSREALGRYTFSSAISPTTLAECILMSSPSPPALQQLRRLNRHLSGFHDQLNSVLYGEEYKQCVPNLQGSDLVWLVDYLDKVHCRVVLPQSPLKPA